MQPSQPQALCDWQLRHLAFIATIGSFDADGRVRYALRRVGWCLGPGLGQQRVFVS